MARAPARSIESRCLDLALSSIRGMTITLNGDPHDVAGPVTVSELLSQLQIDPRRVAVELNLVVVKRAAFETTRIEKGDQVEIVNFVGGG